MKLIQYAKQQGISYRTALRWWKAGLVKGYQSPTGTIIVREEPPKEVLAVQRVAIYARVSSHEHRENLERQAERMISAIVPRKAIRCIWWLKRSHPV